MADARPVIPVDMSEATVQIIYIALAFALDDPEAFRRYLIQPCFAHPDGHFDFLADDTYSQVKDKLNATIDGIESVLHKFNLIDKVRKAWDVGING